MDDRLQGLLQMLGIGRGAVVQDHQIDRRGDARIIRCAKNGREVGKFFFFCALAEILHHVRFEIDAVDATLRQQVRKAHRKVAGARADIGNRRVRG